MHNRSLPQTSGDLIWTSGHQMEQFIIDILDLQSLLLFACVKWL